VRVVAEAGVEGVVRLRRGKGTSVIKGCATGRGRRT
jgi:hypothetical protein